MFLYVVTNRVNGKQYVGITNDVIRRKRFHFSGHGSKLLHHAIKKYGRHNFDFNAWYEGDECFIKMMECSIIVALGTRAPHGYNLTWGGDGTRGLRLTDETRKKLSAAHKGQVNLDARAASYTRGAPEDAASMEAEVQDGSKESVRPSGCRRGC